MVCTLSDGGKTWFLATAMEGKGIAGNRVSEPHSVRRLLARLPRGSRGFVTLKSLLTREGGSAALGLPDDRVIAEAERRLAQGRWILVEAPPKKASVSAAKAAAAPAWVADDDGGVASNDQGLSLAPEAELEEPLSLEIEEEEEPPFSMEVEDETPVPEEATLEPEAEASET